MRSSRVPACVTAASLLAEQCAMSILPADGCEGPDVFADTTDEEGGDSGVAPGTDPTKVSATGNLNGGSAVGAISVITSRGANEGRVEPGSTP